MKKLAGSSVKELVSKEDMKKLGFEIVDIEDKFGGNLSVDKIFKLLNIEKNELKKFEDKIEEKKPENKNEPKDT